MQILEKKESGFRIQGCDLNLNFLNKESILDTPNGKSITTMKSFFNFNFPVAKLEQITPSGIIPIIDHSSEKLLTLQAKWRFSEKRLKAINSPTQEDISELFEELQFDGKLNGLIINLNLSSFEKLFYLLVPLDFISNTEETKKPELKKEDSQPKLGQRKKINLVKDWNDIKINLEISNTTLNLQSGSRNLELNITSMNLINDPLWYEFTLYLTHFLFI